MSSVLWDVEHPMYVWEEASGCYGSSFYEEELDTGEVELYLPPVMDEDEQLVLKQRASEVIKQEFDNLSKEEIQKHHKEVAEA
eukprot:11578597-Prorocentrum_lima.AAC.1